MKGLDGASVAKLQPTSLSRFGVSGSHKLVGRLTDAHIGRLNIALAFVMGFADCP
jgi:hypothetical protein